MRKLPANRSRKARRVSAAPPRRAPALPPTIPIDTKNDPRLADPEVYAMCVRGDCLAPQINDGDYIVASPNAHPKNGDFAVIYFKGAPMPAVKRVGMVPPRHMMTTNDRDEVVSLIALEMLNPPMRRTVAVDKIAALHAVLDIIPAKKAAARRVAR